MNIAIVTDSTCDLPGDWVKENPVNMIPTILVIGESQYRDGVEISRKEFYDRLPNLNPAPTTASPSPRAFADAYKSFLSGGFDHVISIHVASPLSSIFGTAKMVADNFKGRITVIDSGQLSLGLGFQVMAAAETALKGGGLQDTLDAIQNVTRRIRLMAMLDTLDQLKRSGRVSWMHAGLGALLKVKLFIEVIEGQVNRLGETRTRGKGIERLKQMLMRLGPLDRLAILHTNAEEDARNFLSEFAVKVPTPPLLANVNTVIGSHVGPKAIGFAAILAEQTDNVIGYAQ